MESLLLGMPTSCLPNGNEFERAMLHDAMRLVVECHVHKCGPSCFKYTASKTKYQLCRHMLATVWGGPSRAYFPSGFFEG